MSSSTLRLDQVKRQSLSQEDIALGTRNVRSWTSSEDEHTTTVLIKNIHCSSCSSHIDETLSRLGKSIMQVRVNIVNDEVCVLHASSVPTLHIFEALSDAGFDVHSATTFDHRGKLISEINAPPSGEGLRDGASSTWRFTPLASSFQSSPIATKRRQQQHVENCLACQAEQRKLSGLLGKDNTPWSENEKPEACPSLDGSKLPQEVSEKPLGEERISQWTSGEVQQSSGQNVILGATAAAEPTYTLILSIGGMTCASCTSAINDAVKELSFVKSVSVDLMTSSAVVNYSGTEELKTAIMTKVEDIGYEATAVSIEPIAPKTTHKPAVASSPSLYRAVLSIGGMTCASCTNAITDGLKELAFIKSVSVSLMTNSGVVTYEGNGNLDVILQKVDDLGYDAEVEQSSPVERDYQGSLAPELRSRTIQLEIDGMFCDNCPTRIASTLQSAFHGLVVVDKQPTLKAPVITITYQPDRATVTIRDIVSVVNSTSGTFRTRVYHPPSIEERSRAMQIHDRRRTLQRLLLSFIVAIPTLLIGVVWMSLVPSSNSTRMFFEEPMWTGEVTRAEWALFILATPVMFFAADAFHLRAIKEIRALWRKGSKVPIARRFYRFGSMNLLVSAGTSVAYISSIALLIIGATTKGGNASGTTYFDTVVFLTFFILIGRYLEAYSKSKTGDAVSMLGRLKPQEALLIVSSSDKALSEGSIATDDKFIPPTKTQTINADLLEVGDRVIVPRGSSPPADGTIISGLGQFDESSLTGESRTVKKGPGETVFVGTVNIGNPITVEVVGIGGTSMLDQIVAVVREGQTKRAPVERVADMITGYFVPVITALAITTFFVWFALGQSGFLDPKYLNGQAGGWAFWSLEFAIAVFVVACPCGIGLAAPTALFVGGGLAARHGILVRGGGEAFQEAGTLDAVVFDKTGTLTEGGQLKVADHEAIAEKDEASMAWSIARSLEEQSSHPIAQAILEFSKQQSSTSVETDSISEEPGLGVRGTFTTSSADGTTVKYEAALGSDAFMATLKPNPPPHSYFSTTTLQRWQSEAKSIAVLAIRPHSSESGKAAESCGWRIAIMFATTDPVRPTALSTIRTLKSRGLSVYMLSGDNPDTARAVASSLDIPITNVFAGVLPTQKAEKIEWLKQHAPRRAKPYGTVGRLMRRLRVGKGRLERKEKVAKEEAKIAFVGDGINDAPALLASTVSISLSSGSSIALNCSSFILLSPSLLTVPLLLDLSSRVFRRIKFNFGWALVYNVILVPVAAGILFRVREEGWRLGPVWASAAMAGSSVSVVLSSLALRWEGHWRVWRRDGSEDGE